MSVAFWVGATSVGLLLLRDPLSLATVGAALLLVIAATDPRLLLRLLQHWYLLLAIPLSLLMFHASVHDGRTLVEIGPVTISAEGLAVGFVLSMRILIVVSASLVFLWVVDIRELMSSLIRLGMPYRLAFAVYIALRYVPLLKVEREGILDAFAVRRQSSSLSWGWRLRLWSRYILLLVVSGLRSADQTALAMESRGFGLQRQRTSVTKSRLTLAGPLFVAGWVAFLAAVYILGR